MRNKKGKKGMPRYSSERNDTTSTTEQNIDSMSALEMTATNQPSTPESNISEPLLSGALNTISKQVKEIADSLPKKIASREDLRQLLEATSGKLDSVAGNINNSLYSIDTVTKDVYKKINGVLSNKIQQAEDSVRQNICSNMERGLQTLLTKLQSKISSDAVSATNSVNNSINSAAQKILTAQRNSNAALTQQLGDMEERLKNIGESTEMIQSLPSKIDDITDDITEILSAKGLQIKQEFPAINHDEETLAQLAQYGEKILQQLAIAARWYARKMPELSKHEDAIRKLNETHEKDLIRAGKDGEARGRKAAVRDLLERYGENIHDLMKSAESDGGRLNVLATFLKNEGVEQIYQLHEEREITNDNLMNYEHNIANLRAGKIVITSPGYSFDNEVISKATYMPAEEFYAAQAAEQQVEENSAVDTETENTAPDSQAEENFAPQADDTPHESENVVQGDENSAVTNEVASNEKVSAEG